MADHCGELLCSVSCRLRLRLLKLTDIVIILGFLAFGSVVQIPGIGGGIQITAIVVLTQLYGLPLENASGIAVFIWVLTFAVVVPFGLLCAFLQGMELA